MIDLEQSLRVLEIFESSSEPPMEAGFARDTKEVKSGPRGIYNLFGKTKGKKYGMLWSSPDTNFGGKGIQVGESLSLSKINMYSALAQKI